MLPPLGKDILRDRYMNTLLFYLDNTCIDYMVYTKITL